MYSQIRRTQKAKSEHQSVKKNSRTSKIPHSSIRGVPTSNTDINHLSITDKKHIFMPHIYNGDREYKWNNRWKIVEEAIFDAIKHLNNALNDPMVKKHKIIIDAIRNVINILEAQNLEIYPFFGKSDGLAKIDEYKISIRTTLITQEKNLYRLEKTLIHEAFHIIGGCVKGESNDSICEENVDKDGAFEKIVSKESIGQMEADDFAHFIMRC